MDIAKLNPYIRAVKRSVIPAHGNIRRRIIFDYEIIYIEDGEFTLRYNDTDHICRTGDFLLLRPGVPHSFSGIHRDLSQPHIHFDMVYDDNSRIVPISFKDLPDLNAQEVTWIREDVFRTYPKIPQIRFRDPAAALALFDSITADPTLSPLTRKGKFLQLLDMLMCDNFPELPLKNSTLLPVENEIKDYIDAGQGLSASLDDFAKQFMYSKYYLERRFKAAFGVSLITYRNQMRMQYAQNLLMHKSVTAVSEKLGFSSVYAFSRAFRLHFGFSPSKVKETSGQKS